MDRRVQKSRTLLCEALKSLVIEKDYDKIAVQEIIERANVGRSTFYTHFSHKDELLMSSIHEMLSSVPAMGSVTQGHRSEKLIWFSLPVFKAIGHHRHSGEARMGPRGRAILHGYLQQVLATRIAEEAKKDLQASLKRAGPIPRDLLVQHVASTFILVLDWWVESRSKLPPEEVNDLFRSLVLPALSSGWE